MGLFDKVKKTTIESRRYEEKLYEVALEEVEAGEVRKGLYAKALSKADGDKEKADGIYLKLRVQAIMDDIEAKQIDHRDSVRVLSAMQTLESKEDFLKEPQLTDYDFNFTDIENLNKAYKKASYSLLLVIALLGTIWIFLMIDSHPDLASIVIAIAIVIGLTSYAILIFPIRYLISIDNAKYISISDYNKAIKKYNKSLNS